MCNSYRYITGINIGKALTFFQKYELRFMDYDISMGVVLKMIGFRCIIVVLLLQYLNGIEPGCEGCGCCINKKCGTEYVDGLFEDRYCTHGCIAGFGGNKCYNKCPDDCVTCEQNIPKNCATCDESKFVNDDKRCMDCPKNCKSCTSATRCHECYHPYYNDGFKQDCSLSCPKNCMCENLGVCSSCRDGFYNVSNTCRNSCPDTCKTCTDERHCRSCKPWYSGDICCVKNGHCHKCSSSSVCEKCSDGYYGDQCGRTCPTKCKSSHCNRENGNCFSCLDGNYGTQCGKTCPKTCHELQCEMTIGKCLSCAAGLYGNFCTHDCLKTCLDDRCNQENGQCSDGCIAGFTGSYCIEVNIDTSSCARDIGIDTVIGISATILVVIETIVIMVTIIIVRRWKMNFLKKYQSTSNAAGYVSTQFQTTSIDTIDVSVNNDQIDEPEYERLDEQTDRQRHEYEQITPVNK